jgi:murein DD-endopeptidase MepM/ murein hydrolase activator NlpD
MQSHLLLDLPPALMSPASMKNLLRVLALGIMLPCIPHVALCSDTLASNSLTITPTRLANGSPCLIKVELQSEATAVSGRWQNRKIAFYPSHDKKSWYALTGVDVEVKPGTYPLAVEATQKDGRRQTLHQQVTIGEAPYAQITLHVPDKFVAPDAEELKAIAADKIVKDKAFADTSATPQWTGNFLPPLKAGARSDSFGTRRVFNGTVASVHRGLDYHAAIGTPVAAINSGHVVLAIPLYFEGGCVMVDHGMGLMSVYMHLSKIEVATGDTVTRGQIIALSGGSGRATGPHLHLGIRWQGSYLDPAKLFALTMPALH